MFQEPPGYGRVNRSAVLFLAGRDYQLATTAHPATTRAGTANAPATATNRPYISCSYSGQAWFNYACAPTFPKSSVRNRAIRSCAVAIGPRCNNVSDEGEDYIETRCGLRIDVEAIQLVPEGTDDIDCPACIAKAAFTDSFPLGR